MDEDDVKLIWLCCPICGHRLVRVALGSVLEIKCWRNDCSKPILRFPPRYLEIVPREIKNSGTLSTVLT